MGQQEPGQAGTYWDTLGGRVEQDSQHTALIFRQRPRGPEHRLRYGVPEAEQTPLARSDVDCR